MVLLLLSGGLMSPGKQRSVKATSDQYNHTLALDCFKTHQILKLNAFSHENPALVLDAQATTCLCRLPPDSLPFPAETGGHA